MCLGSVIQSGTDPLRDTVGSLAYLAFNSADRLMDNTRDPKIISYKIFIENPPRAMQISSPCRAIYTSALIKYANN